MSDWFSTIEALRSIRKKKDEINEEEKRLSMPLMSDISFITNIWEWVENSVINLGVQKMDIQRIFILITLSLYAPRSLAGRKIPSGLRDVMAASMGDKYPTFISHNIHRAVVHYQTYKDFREQADLVFDMIKEKLTVKGFLNENTNENN